MATETERGRFVWHELMTKDPDAAQTVPSVGRFAVLRDPQGAAFAVITSEAKLGEETDPKPREFSWHELITTDYKAADKFYSKLFGWESKSEVDMGDMGMYHMFGR